MQHTSGEYDALLDQIQSRLADETDFIANVAVFSALLFDGIEAVDWTGVYLLRGEELVLGPFQGRAAPSRVPVSHPTIGRALREGRSMVTADMAVFAFDEDELPARSQTAVPLFFEERAIGVLVVDSPFVGRFGEDDRIGLEAASTLVVGASDMNWLDAPATRRPNVKPAREASRRGARNGAYPAPAPAPPEDELPEEATLPARPRPPRARRTTSRSAMILRRVVFFASAAILFSLALSGAVYDATSPGDWSWHVPLRKAYSIVAFTWVGFFLCVGWRRVGVRRAALVVAIFSAIVEIGQYFAGSHEGPWFNLLDVVCGAIGGYLGALLARSVRNAVHRRRAARTR